MPELTAGRAILLNLDGETLTVRLGRVPVRVYGAGNFTLDAILDEGAYVVVTAAAVVTVPPDLPDGWMCSVRRATTGAVSFVAGSGVTLHSADSLVIITENRAVSVVAGASNAVYLDGALE